MCAAFKMVDMALRQTSTRGKVRKGCVGMAPAGVRVSMEPAGLAHWPSLLHARLLHGGFGWKVRALCYA